MSFSFTHSAIEPEILNGSMREPEIGAIVSFEGRVRKFNDGHQVIQLEYEAYESLATNEALKIIEEACHQFGATKANCLHRLGVLNIGECAVWIAVSAPHRNAAFRACRYIVDELKLRVPIWKRETYVDGTSEWVACNHGKPSHSESRYYQKQLLLPEFADSQQTKLANSKVLVVGVGALGSPALLYLAGAGIGTIGICDDDVIEFSDLHRQILYSASQTSESKVWAAQERATELNPFVKVVAHQERLNAHNAKDIVGNYDLIVDCTDNIVSKLLLNDTAIRLSLPIIQASIYQYEGQLHRWLPTSSHTHNSSKRRSGLGQCLRCLWPGTLSTGEQLGCSEVGVLGPVPGVLGSMQAMEAIKYLLDLPSPLDQNILLLDLLTLEIRKIKCFAIESCVACSETSHSHSDPDQIEIDLSSSFNIENFELLDLRTRNPLLPEDLESNKMYLLYCNTGFSSANAAIKLRQQGLRNVYSVRGGIKNNPALRNLLSQRTTNSKQMEYSVNE